MAILLYETSTGYISTGGFIMGRKQYTWSSVNKIKPELLISEIKEKLFNIKILSNPFSGELYFLFLYSFDIL